VELLLAQREEVLWKIGWKVFPSLTNFSFKEDNMSTEQNKRNIRIHTAVSLFLIFLLLSNIGTGCSGASKSTRTETETTVTHPADQSTTSLHPTETTTVKKELTTETETESSSGGGVLSTTVDVIGEIIALPFRLIGGLIRFIF
jgi:hypothetical protein